MLNESIARVVRVINERAGTMGTVAPVAAPVVAEAAAEVVEAPVAVAEVTPEAPADVVPAVA
jgi:hypothetical protein